MSKKASPDSKQPTRANQERTTKTGKEQPSNAADNKDNKKDKKQQEQENSDLEQQYKETLTERD